MGEPAWACLNPTIGGRAETQERRAAVRLQMKLPPKERYDLHRLLGFLRGISEDEFKEIRRRSSPIDDMVYYHFLCQQNQVENVIEIGTFKGLSALFWASAISGTLYTINKSASELVAAKDLARRAGLKNIEFIEGDSLEVLKELPAKIKGDINVVYIDGWHDYHYSYNEYVLTEPYLDKSKGLIIWDDADAPHPDGKNDGGVPRTIKEVGADLRVDFGSRFAHKAYGDFKTL